ncbi:hypothetical protein BSL78_10132 [Apostichopus japonicus]|uniref:Uncharacterized protein n=1 Tax=Stichopus japonicus TaxID=307972 RepID=A0A2G8KYA6_STIJA|nr:hypothetical protein BSL78_10132 [Apostichopus japonicus]
MTREPWTGTMTNFTVLQRALQTQTLSNHLIQKHIISTKEYRQKILKQSRAMKCKEPKRQEGQQRRSFRDCPAPDCPSVLLPRIDKHLQQVHNYKTSSAEYHQLLSAAPDSKKETEEGGKKEEEEEDFLVEMEDTPKDILDIYVRRTEAEGTEQSKKNAQQHCRQVQAIKERLGISLRSLILPSSVQRYEQPLTNKILSIVLLLKVLWNPSGEEKKVPEHPDGSHAAERRTPWLCHHRSPLGEFQAAKQKTNKNWVIAVANHKRSSTY